MLDNLIATIDDDDMTPQNGFGAILERKNRYDIYVPNSGLYNECLKELLNKESIVQTFFHGLFGEKSPDAKFNELSCVVSDKGALRQPIHPDEHYCDHALTYSVFIALQDIDLSMGPTVILPRTNVEEAHVKFNADTNTKNAYLKT